VLGAASVAILLAAAAEARALVPLRIEDETERAVFVEVEGSSDLAIVGQSFGPPFPATYSASGGVGTLVISAETHAAMRAGFLEPVPGSFTPIEIEIDLATRHATSGSASGALASGPISMTFTQNPLASDAVLGFVGPDIGPIPCTSQQQVDDFCAIFPLFCGKICTLVPGAAFDPATGKLNLVGTETQSGCDGSLCDGPFTLFTGQGDLRLREPFVAPVPALSPPATALLAAALLAAGALAARGGERQRSGAISSSSRPAVSGKRSRTTSGVSAATPQSAAMARQFEPRAP
jgi:hypothetical protein